jgi:hypothetical protein
MSAVLHSMRCVCGHWDTEHAAFTADIRPGITRTFCDHCDCHSWMTPSDQAAMRTPRVLDRVLTWAETATIVKLAAGGYAHIERDDDVRLIVPVERLRWLADREAWVIVPEGAA